MPRALVPLAAAAAAAVVFFSDGAAAATAKTCTTLVDKSAPLYSALSLLKMGGNDSQDLSIAEMLAPVDVAFPWLSKCLGSADILAVGMAAISDPALSKCVSMVMSASSNNASASVGDLSALVSSNSDSDVFGASICPMLNATIIPCLDTIYTKTLPALLESGGTCCDDMASEMTQALGTKPEETLKALTRRVGDMVCAVKSYKDSATGAARNATCGQAWLTALSNGSALMDDLLTMAQIPNNQACAAMTGSTFTTTTGETTQLFRNATPIDACFAPVNLMLTDMSKMPMVSQMQLTELFADGKCLKGQTVLDWMRAPNGTVKLMADAIDKMLATSYPELLANNASSSSSDSVMVTVDDGLKDMEALLANKCFHLPNSVSPGCKYASSVQFAYFTNASTQAEATSNPTPSASSPASTASFSLLYGTLALAAVFASA